MASKYDNLIFCLHALKLCGAYNAHLKGQEVSISQGVLSITVLPSIASFTASLLFGIPPPIFQKPHILFLYAKFSYFLAIAKLKPISVLLASLDIWLRTKSILSLGVRNAVGQTAYQTIPAIIFSAGLVGSAAPTMVNLLGLFEPEWNFSCRRFDLLAVDIWAPFAISALATISSASKLSALDEVTLHVFCAAVFASFLLLDSYISVRVRDQSSWDRNKTKIQ